MIKKIIASAVAITALGFSTTIMAQAFSFLKSNHPTQVNTSTPYSASIVEGKDYIRVTDPNEQLNPVGNRAKIVEFFGYPCGHCFDMQPMLENFKKTHPKVDVDTIPVVFPGGDVWNKGAQLYFSLKELGLTPETHNKIFNLMHVEHKYILDNQALRDSELAKLGYKPEQVEQMMTSFTIQSKMKNDSLLMNQYKINGTPTFVVNNKYITSPALTQSYEKTIAVLNYLADKKD